MTFDLLVHLWLGYCAVHCTCLCCNWGWCTYDHDHGNFGYFALARASPVINVGIIGAGLGSSSLIHYLMEELKTRPGWTTTASNDSYLNIDVFEQDVRVRSMCVYVYCVHDQTILHVCDFLICLHAQ